MENKITFESNFNTKQFISYLHNKVTEKIDKKSVSILFSKYNANAKKLILKLQENSNIDYYFHFVDEVIIDHHNFIWHDNFEDIKNYEINIIVATETNSKNVYTFLSRIMKCKDLINIPFIYKIRGNESYPLLFEQDQIRELGLNDDHVYITNQFDHSHFDDIYRYSLSKVRRKCQLRDAYDLFQCLQNVENIKGDIVEFGSHEGHSGILIAEYLKRNLINKNLFLCDTFEQFPFNEYGIDEMWSGRDEKDFTFEDVKRNFTDYINVELIKGEFKDTIHRIREKDLCFAYIDCDSYESTKFLFDTIFPILNTGGCIACEDYGHHNLLSARKAVDEFIDSNKNRLVHFFSFFSGFKIIYKIN